MNNLDATQAALCDLRNTYESYEPVQDRDKRMENISNILNSTDLLSEKSTLKEEMSTITAINLKIRSELQNKGITYEQLIAQADLLDADKDLLYEFLPDLKFLLPIGGPNFERYSKQDKPDKKIIKSWKEVILVLGALAEIGKAGQMFVDLSIAHKENEQNRIENTLRFQEIQQKDRELDQKDKELELKERELYQQENDDKPGMVNLSDK